MHIRKRKVQSNNLKIHHKKTIEIIQKAICEIEVTPKYKNTIGAEISISQKKVTLEISAFNSIHLSTFITKLLIKLRNETIDILHASKTIECFYSPVYTHIIEIK